MKGLKYTKLITEIVPLGGISQVLVPLGQSGQAALDLYQDARGEIDLVILDMIMPGMGGRETYDRLKAIDSRLKVLLSSGYSVEGQAQEILERGCEGFIQKPFTMAAVSSKISEILYS